jgi:hypothetical protein
MTLAFSVAATLTERRYRLVHLRIFGDELRGRRVFTMESVYSCSEDPACLFARSYGFDGTAGDDSEKTVLF